MKSNIAQAKAEIDAEQKQQKKEAAGKEQARPGPVPKGAKSVAERKACSADVIGLAAAVSALAIQKKPGGLAQQSKRIAKAKAKAKGKTDKKTETEKKPQIGDGKEQEGNDPEETPEVVDALEEFEEVADDEELNKQAKAKGKAKSQKKETEPAGKAKAKAKAVDGQVQKNPLDSFLGKEWTKFKDEMTLSLKGKMKYHDMLKEISR
ncbi:NHX3, partial [Symbiodinium sp. KB8]